LKSLRLDQASHNPSKHPGYAYYSYHASLCFIGGILLGTVLRVQPYWSVVSPLAAPISASFLPERWYEGTPKSTGNSMIRCWGRWGGTIGTHSAAENKIFNDGAAAAAAKFSKGVGSMSAGRKPAGRGQLNIYAPGGNPLHFFQNSWL
jgi:predicted DNA-binding WGR domain protein